ncbi:Abi family protein [Mycobacteroides abscessus]|uniref:Abi family protein n=1 Tax=Mycobacteroides abscessus TaxID=36809 RepID=UPI000E6A0D8C|nr:Abi family protein [Mycobacteroides abscessus]RIS87871.1 Abi family protein [Mycobacteroides abscessus]
MTTAYDKPHLSYEDQVRLMKSRGLQCPDEAAAVQLLQQVGYYRLSAYVYPFREMLPASEARRESPAHYRSNTIRDGTSFDDVQKLWRFDRKLRLKILDALETVEIGLRTRLAYVLGERHKFGHLERDALDANACEEPCQDESAADAFGEWLARYEKLKDAAKNEDFMVHHRCKYGDPIPVWIAVEFLDFGALCKLYRLMEKSDQNAVAISMGVKGGTLLRRWLRDLNYLRNLCAHHSRLWNRVLTYKSAKFNDSQVGPDLAHAAKLEVREKIYVLSACLAYLVRHVDPVSTWHTDFRTHVRKFPAVQGKSPESDMGFPEGWADLSLWQPRK